MTRDVASVADTDIVHKLQLAQVDLAGFATPSNLLPGVAS